MSDPLSAAAEERAAKPAYERDEQAAPVQAEAVWVAPEVVTTDQLIEEEERASKEKKKSTNLFGDFDDDPVFQKKPKKKSSLFDDDDDGGLFGKTAKSDGGKKADGKPATATVNLFDDGNSGVVSGGTDLDAALSKPSKVPEQKLNVPEPSRANNDKDTIDIDTSEVAHSSKLGNLFDGGTGPDNEHETGDLFIAPAKDDDEPDLFGGPGNRDLGNLKNTDRTGEERDLLDDGEAGLADDTVKAMEKATAGGAAAKPAPTKKKAAKSSLFDEPSKAAASAFDDDDDLFSMVQTDTGGGADITKSDKFSFADYIAQNKGSSSGGGGGGLFDD